MAVNLYGNIDGKVYRPQMPDLAEMAKGQKQKLVSVQEAGWNAGACVKVNISKEGLRALHGSELSGSRDPRETAERIAFLSEHQPIESFTSRLSAAMLSDYQKAENGEYRFVRHSLQEKADSLLRGFEKLYDEISRGYEDGTRIRYIEDASSEDGFRKLTREEELDILLSEFDEFADHRFGAEHQKQSEMVAKAMNDLQKIKQTAGRGDVRYYEPEVVPGGFLEQIKRAARVIAEKAN